MPTVTELKALAKAANIPGYGKLVKAELEQALGLIVTGKPRSPLKEAAPKVTVPKATAAPKQQGESIIIRVVYTGNNAIKYVLPLSAIDDYAKLKAQLALPASERDTNYVDTIVQRATTTIKDEYEYFTDREAPVAVVAVAPVAKKLVIPAATVITSKTTGRLPGESIFIRMIQDNGQDDGYVVPFSAIEDYEKLKVQMALPLSEREVINEETNEDYVDMLVQNKYTARVDGDEEYEVTKAVVGEVQVYITAYATVIC